MPLRCTIDDIIKEVGRSEYQVQLTIGDHPRQLMVKIIPGVIRSYESIDSIFRGPEANRCILRRDIIRAIAALENGQHIQFPRNVELQDNMVP